MALGLLFLLMFAWIGKAMATKQDQAWLPRFVIYGYAAKLLATLARYYMVAVLYATGDSFRYHDVGRAFASVWRGLAVPLNAGGNPGTAFTESVTGFIYAIYTPTFLGGFIIFGMLGFFGQLLFYAAFRPWMPPRKQKLYATAVLFLPSLLFWPSSIGKDALMVLFLGMASYGASRLIRSYSLGTLFIIGPALYLAARIRPHVAAIMGLSLVLTLLFGKAPKSKKGSPKRAVMLLIAVAGTVAVLAIFSSTFDVTVEPGRDTQDVGTFLADVSERTSGGGSGITGGAISSPSQFPAAFVTVLFRPLIHEGTNPQVILSAVEGTFLLLLFVWKLPTMWRNRRLLRERSYLLMSFFYTGGFVIGFSAVLNLGILARQRVQVLPYFLAWIVGLGWAEGDTEPSPAIPASPETVTVAGPPSG